MPATVTSGSSAASVPGAAAAAPAAPVAVSATPAAAPSATPAASTPPTSSAKPVVKAAPPTEKPSPATKDQPDKAPPASKAAELVSAIPAVSTPSTNSSSTGAVAAVPAKSTPVPVLASSPAAPKAATPVSRVSAAAVTDPKVKAVTAMERVEATGSVMATGTGAKAAPAAAPKAKAAPAVPAAPKVVANPSSTSSSTLADVQPSAISAPVSVVEIVTGKPTPAQEGGKNVAHGYPTPPPPGSMPVLGPARTLAAVAAPLIPREMQKGLEVPREGPAAVAVGRAAVSGLASSLSRAASGKARVQINKKYQIVFCSAEVAPFSKTGGLGEAMDGLPTALAALGHRVMVVTPRYDQYKEAWDTGFHSSVTMAGKSEPVHFFHAYKQKVDYVFVDHPTFLERVDGLSGSKVYGPEWGKDFADNQPRFAYFCKAVLVAIADLPLAGFPYGQQCMVVANDWHSALVPMLIHAQRSSDPTLWADTKTVFLCHNAVFQGRFEREEGIAEVLGVSSHYIDSITFKMPLRVGKYNEKVVCINTMAAGLRYCDRALTVSPSYAQECFTDAEKGVELEALFALARVTGILNGVKEGVTPANESFVATTAMSCGTFTPATADAAKEELKVAYRSQNGLPVSKGPLMCFIGRLDAQKGYDLLLDALIEVLPDCEMQIVIVGAGRDDLVAQTRAMQDKFAGKFFYGGWMGPERYAMLGGCDFTLLPSRWEPCGLVQMEAMRMGTLPIVAPTGGLKDTVEDGVNGLWTDSEMTIESEIEPQSVASIAKALRRATELFLSEPGKISEMKKAAMAAAAEFTWSNAALQYEAIFEELGAVDVLPLSIDKTVTLETDKQVC